MTTENSEKGLTIPEQRWPIINDMAKAFVESGMFKDVKSQAQAIVKIVAGQELGFAPVYSMQKVYIIEGKVAIAAEAMGAMIKKSKEYDYEPVEWTNDKCTIRFLRQGKPVLDSTFTIADAKLAGLVKTDGAWAKWPRAMLWSKCLSQGARAVCPHLIAGTYTPEEFGYEVQEDGDIVQVAATTVISTDGATDTTGWLEQCPIHNATWLLGKVNPPRYPVAHRWHKDSEGKYCNFDKVIGVEYTKLFKDSKAVNDWLKENFGKTWSKMEDEEMVTGLKMLQDGDSENDLPTPYAEQKTDDPNQVY